VSDEKRCGNCRHWGSSLVTDMDQRQCLRIKHGQQSIPDGEIVAACDAEMYEAWLMTAPTFCCVLFEAKRDLIEKVMTNS